MIRVLVCGATLTVLGCTVAQDLDEERESFSLPGKPDAAAVTEGSPQALAVLRVVNEVSGAVLDDEVALDRRAADGIIAHRLGPDAAVDTPDDDPFDTLAELDAVPFIGPRAFAKLLAYAEANDFFRMRYVTSLARLHETVLPEDEDFLKRLYAPESTDRFGVHIAWARARHDNTWLHVRDFTGTIVRSILLDEGFEGWLWVDRGEMKIQTEFRTHWTTDRLNYHIDAISYRVVDDGDPTDMACVIGSINDGYDSGILENLDSASSGTCASPRRSQALSFTAPSDATYTVAASVHEFGAVYVHESCRGALLGCSGNRVRTKANPIEVRLAAGQTVVVLVDSASYDVDVEMLESEADHCLDGFDDDADGSVDCADADCRYDDACVVEEVCDNLVDDDGDALSDCLDPECSSDALCGVNVCPGLDIASSLGAQAATGSAVGAPAFRFMTCEQLVWDSSRHFLWTAPHRGRFRFRIPHHSRMFSVGLRVLEGACDADSLGCLESGGGSIPWHGGIAVSLDAGEQVVIEVGMSNQPLFPGDIGKFALEIEAI